MAAATNTNLDFLADSAVTVSAILQCSSCSCFLAAELQQQQGHLKAWQFTEHTRHAGPVPCDEAAFSIKKKNWIFRSLILNVPVRITGVGNNQTTATLSYSSPRLAIWAELPLFNNLRPKAGRPVPLTPEELRAAPQCMPLPLLHDRRALAHQSSLSQIISLILLLLVPPVWDINCDWNWR